MKITNSVKTVSAGWNLTTARRSGTGGENDKYYEPDGTHCLKGQLYRGL